MRNKDTRIKLRLLLLLMLPFLASSCSEDSNLTTTSNDYCYIKSVVLGTVKRKTNTLNTSFSASTFEMTINQRDNTIENRDSLPYGSLLNRVIATIAFDGSSLAYREKGTEAWTSYNSTDSLDLTKPLELYLTSNDNQSSRIYTLKVNVHQQEDDSLVWKQCDTGNEALTSLNDMKVFVLNNKLTVLGKKGADIVLVERSDFETEGTWEETATTDLPATVDLQTLRMQEGILYLSTTDGQILSSTDAKAWESVGTIYSAGLTLIEKTKDFFYVISEGKLLRSLDAATWEEDLLDTDAAQLPVSEIRALSVEQANGNSRIILVGQKEGCGNAVVWNKMWNDSEKEEDAEWMFFPISPDNRIPCPQLNHFNLLPYDGNCIAFGGTSVDGEHEALDAIYISKDYGITWRPNNGLHLPKELKGTEGCITSTVDENNFIWIITNAQVWRGRLNRLGFAQQ
ncbi:MAG: hypothetical protein IKW91_11775 [Bacteroidaceae bacterium]|nr:hypothetical protein [Bacteroidaceae bacterium]